MVKKIIDNNTGKQYLVHGPIHENEAAGVWCGKAHDEELGDCFVKIVACPSRDDVNRMKDEARCAALVEKCSRQVPKLYAHWEDCRNKQYVLITQWMEGESLRSWMEHSHPANWTERALRERMDIIRQICTVMESIARDRQGQALVHRDLKPENLMIRRNGKRWEVYVVDFGCALLGYVRNVGTTGYQAPEQTGIYRDYPARITQKTDVFAIGQIFYELLLGQVPKIGTDYVRRAGEFVWTCEPTLPDAVKALLADDGLERLLRRMTAFKAEERAGYTAIITELRRVNFIKKG